MTRDEWHEKLKETQQDLKKLYPHKDGRWILAKSHRIMRSRYGPEPKGLPVKIRLALWALKRMLRGMNPTEVPMLWQKVIVALVFGIGATVAAFNLALEDGSITRQEWMAILSAFIAAAWGKFSSNTTIIAASRKGEDITGPR